MQFFAVLLFGAGDVSLGWGVSSCVGLRNDGATDLVCYDGAAGGSGICCDLSRQLVIIWRCWRFKNQRTTTPLSKTQPTIVVPVLVALGRGTPLA